MEQLDGTFRVQFHAFVSEGGGARTVFSFRVDEPCYDPDRGYYCVVTCEFLRDMPFKIFGVDEYQAFQEAVRFIHLSLKDRDVAFFDEAGQPVDLPEPLPSRILPE